MNMSFFSTRSLKQASEQHSTWPQPLFKFCSRHAAVALVLIQVLTLSSFYTPAAHALAVPSFLGSVDKSLQLQRAQYKAIQDSLRATLPARSIAPERVRNLLGQLNASTLPLFAKWRYCFVLNDFSTWLNFDSEASKSLFEEVHTALEGDSVLQEIDAFYASDIKDFLGTIKLHRLTSPDQMPRKNFWTKFVVQLAFWGAILSGLHSIASLGAAYLFSMGHYLQIAATFGGLAFTALVLLGSYLGLRHIFFDHEEGGEEDDNIKGLKTWLVNGSENSVVEGDFKLKHQDLKDAYVKKMRPWVWGALVGVSICFVVSIASNAFMVGFLDHMGHSVPFLKILAYFLPATVFTEIAFAVSCLLAALGLQKMSGKVKASLIHEPQQQLAAAKQAIADQVSKHNSRNESKDGAALTRGSQVLLTLEQWQAKAADLKSSLNTLHEALIAFMALTSQEKEEVDYAQRQQDAANALLPCVAVPIASFNELLASQTFLERTQKQFEQTRRFWTNSERSTPLAGDPAAARETLAAASGDEDVSSRILASRRLIEAQLNHNVYLLQTLVANYDVVTQQHKTSANRHPLSTQQAQQGSSMQDKKDAIADLQNRLTSSETAEGSLAACAEQKLRLLVNPTAHLPDQEQQQIQPQAWTDHDRTCIQTFTALVKFLTGYQEMLGSFTALFGEIEAVGGRVESLESERQDAYRELLEQLSQRQSTLGMYRSWLSVVQFDHAALQAFLNFSLKESFQQLLQAFETAGFILLDPIYYESASDASTSVDDAKEEDEEEENGERALGRTAQALPTATGAPREAELTSAADPDDVNRAGQAEEDMQKEEPFVWPKTIPIHQFFGANEFTAQMPFQAQNDFSCESPGTLARKQQLLQRIQALILRAQKSTAEAKARAHLSKAWNHSRKVQALLEAFADALQRQRVSARSQSFQHFYQDISAIQTALRAEELSVNVDAQQALSLLDRFVSQPLASEMSIAQLDVSQLAYMPDLEFKGDVSADLEILGTLPNLTLLEADPLEADPLEADPRFQVLRKAQQVLRLHTIKDHNPFSQIQLAIGSGYGQISTTIQEGDQRIIVLHPLLLQMDGEGPAAVEQASVRVLFALNKEIYRAVYPQFSFQMSIKLMMFTFLNTLRLIRESEFQVQNLEEAAKLLKRSFEPLALLSPDEVHWIDLPRKAVQPQPLSFGANFNTIVDQSKALLPLLEEKFKHSSGSTSAQLSQIDREKLWKTFKESFLNEDLGRKRLRMPSQFVVDQARALKELESSVMQRIAAASQA